VRIKAIVITMLIVAFLFCMQKAAYAARPLSSEDAGVCGKGNFQLDAGFDYAKEGNKDKSYTFLLAGAYGISQRSDLSVELPYLMIAPGDGNNEARLSDIKLAFKSLIIPEGEINPAIALKIQLKLSNGNEEKNLGSGDEDAGIIFAVSKTLGKLVLHGNLGYTLVGRGRDDTLKNYILYGLAGEYALSTKIKLVMELYGESDSHFDPGSLRHHNLTPLIGFSYQLNEKIVLDTAFKVGISESRRQAYGLTMGCSVQF